MKIKPFMHGIFHELKDARQSYQRWDIPIYVQMAIMYQKSRFVADAEPPRPWLFGIIPWTRANSAYGYAQAKDETWDEYLDSVGDFGADRDDFADAADFIGWYCDISHTKLGIAQSDTRNLYLAYHEGHQGYRNISYLSKSWLQRTASMLANKARLFQTQLDRCQMN